MITLSCDPCLHHSPLVYVSERETRKRFTEGNWRGVCFAFASPWGGHCLPHLYPCPHEGREVGSPICGDWENTFYSLRPAELQKPIDSAPVNTRGGSHLETSWENPRCGPRSFGRFSNMESSFYFHPRELWEEHPEESPTKAEEAQIGLCLQRLAWTR